MKTLADALLLAVNTHRGQRDKYDHPYILHPLRVMARVETETEKMVAILHDVIEDSEMRVTDLTEAGYPPIVVTAVDHLTKRAGENYEHYIQRVRPHPLARRIKMADLLDNMDIRRMPATTWSPKEIARLQRYRRAWETLTAPKETDETL